MAALFALVVPFAAATRSAAAEPAHAFLLGDSVLASIDVTTAARDSLAARHGYLIDAKVCRRLITTSCAYQGVTPSTAIDALTAAAGTYDGPLVVEAGYNDSSISKAVDTIMAEARRQRVTRVLWLTYHEGSAQAATYAQSNLTLQAKALQYPELRLVDFNGYSHAHPEWFASDGLHLKSAGALALAELIGDALDVAYSGNRCTASKVTSTSPAGAAAVTTGGVHALAQPVRLADTRPYLLPPGGNRLLGIQVSGKAGIPTDATAALVTATAVGPCGASYLTLFPCGATAPDASAVNADAGGIVANAVLVRLSSTGALCVYTNVGTDVLVDVAAWVGADGSGATPLVPVRMVDTRPTTDQRLAIPQHRIAAGGVLSVPLGTDQLASGADTVTVNLTAVDPKNRGYLTVFPGPCNATPPNASNLNVEAGRTTAAAATSAIGPAGDVCVFSSIDTDVIVDLNAVNSPGGAIIRTVAPRRIIDTRPSHQQLAAGQQLVIDLDDDVVVAPTTAVGAVLNLTATNPRGDGYVTVAPCTADGTLPYVSNLNMSSGRTVANLVIAAAGDGRRICIRPSVATDVLVDVEGWIG